MDVIFKITTLANLKDLPVKDGQLIIIRDSDAMYYDIDNSRHEVKSTREGYFVTVDTEQIITAAKSFEGLITMRTLQQGNECVASEGSHAEGNSSNAYGDYSHAEGISTTADGEGAHSSGKDTLAEGDYSATFGNTTIAEGKGSLAAGAGTVASADYSTAIGTGNDPQPDDLFEVGNGSVLDAQGNILPEASRTKSNALRVTKDGRAIAETDVELENGIKLSDREAVSNKVTSIGDNPTDNEYPSAKAVKNYIDAMPEPMIFKGTIGTGGTVTSLPAAAANNEGFTYKVITDGTYGGKVSKVGDTLISNGTVWELIPSGDEPAGTVTNVAAQGNNGIKVTGGPITSSGTLVISGVDASQSANGMMSAADKKKLDNISEGANAYSLPTASATTKGGVKIGDNLSMEGEVLNAKDTTYSNATQSVSGLLSASDKKKLDGIASGANAYRLPVASETELGGIKVGENLSISEGKLNAKDTTYSNATQSASGLMSSADKKKLDSIASGAEVNVIETVKVNGTALTPSSKAVNVIVPTKVSELTNDSGFTSTKVEKSSTNGNIKINGTETTVYTHPGGTNPHGTTKSDVGLGNVGNFKAVSTVANQGLTEAEKSNARANIGAGVSSFSGSYNDLTNKPTIPTVGNGTVTIKQAGASKGTFTMNQSGNTTIELTDNNTTYGVATQSTNGLESAADKKKLDGIATGAEVNQNAFSNVVVGSTTIAADSKTDTLTLAGSNVTITPDATNDKVTIGITKANVTSALGYTPPTTNTTYGVATSSALGLVKSGTDITVDSSGNVSVNDDSHNHVISNVDGLQNALDGKASSSHTHNYAGSSSAGGSANSLSYFKNTSKSDIGIDDTSANAIGYVSGTSSILGQNDGAMYKQVYSEAWAHEIYGDYSTGQLAVRSKKNGTWQSWRKILDSNNYTSYCTPANIGAAASSHTHTELMSKYNPTGEGTFSLNRKEGTTVGSYSHAEGHDAEASGPCSHAEGINTTASGYYSHAEGATTTASGDTSHAEGDTTTASGEDSHAEGYKTTASGRGSHAEGSNVDLSNSELSDRTVTIFDVNYTIAGSTAYGVNSHAEGTQSFAYGPSSHAEGSKTTASGLVSHAEGATTTAYGPSSHAEGNSTTASGTCSHAEGYKTTASEYSSHAEGASTTASGIHSHAEGNSTTASNHASHASGKYNVVMTTGGSTGNTEGTAFVIGNGTSKSTLSNAFSVQFNGIVKAKSTITASTTADYAEFFEWLDKNPNEEDRVGHFVTLDGDKIKIATSEDDYILGIVSGEPFVLGNGDCDTWNGMFLHDEFRRTMYEPAPKMIEVEDKEIIEEEYIDEETKEVKTREVEIVVGHHYEEVEGEYEGTRPILNPDYDPTQKYISRFDRAEWSPVGMLGVLAVLHDGTAEVNGYVTVNNEGIATKCTRDTRNSYRVIKKVSDKVVEVIFR